jgi:hypothetical protein
VALPQTAEIEARCAYFITGAEGAPGTSNYGTIGSYVAGRVGAIALPEAMQRVQAFRSQYENDPTADGKYVATLVSDAPDFDQAILEVAAAETGNRPMHYAARGPKPSNRWSTSPNPPPPNSRWFFC